MKHILSILLLSVVGCFGQLTISDPGFLGGLNVASGGGGNNLLDSLAAYWDLDEAAGATRVDSVGGADLTDVNTVGQGTGVISNDAAFTGSSNHALTRTDDTTISTGDIDFTWAGWVKITSGATSFHGLISKRVDSDGHDAEYCFYYGNTSGLFGFIVGDGSSSFGSVTTNLSGFSTGTWHFFVAQHDSVNNLVSIEIDNGGEITASYTAGGHDNATSLSFGRIWNAETTLDLTGELDEVGFWKRTLTSDDRDDLWNGGSGLGYGSFE